jgi:hypothetical protein
VREKRRNVGSKKLVPGCHTLAISYLVDWRLKIVLRGDTGRLRKWVLVVDPASVHRIHVNARLAWRWAAVG